ncbi:hypothetical protein B0H17DRAFT_1203851 [Mycena rosella]|uniref:Epoxide hydrolase n=1 Tax=Mycena rosella TaxID=1033263 RepID=A0AAD7DAT5_MYCRO|nr:hypothetical protein B0H17DRAFT_1203851 [Mycena rosella]
MQAHLMHNADAYLSKMEVLVEHQRGPLLKTGLAAPLCWYKIILGDAKTADDASTTLFSPVTIYISSPLQELHPEAHNVMLPLLSVPFTRDCIVPPILADTNHKKYAKGAFTRRELAADHWSLESHPAEISAILEEWIKGLDV